MRSSTDPKMFYTYEIFASKAAQKEHMEQPYVKAWGAFQYGGMRSGKIADCPLILPYSLEWM